MNEVYTPKSVTMLARATRRLDNMSGEEAIGLLKYLAKTFALSKDGAKCRHKGCKTAFAPEYCVGGLLRHAAAHERDEIDGKFKDGRA